MQRDLDRLLAVLDETGPQLFRLLARITLSEHTAEELLQQMTLKYVEAPERLQTIDNLAGYLHTSAIRVAFNWRREQKVRFTEPLQNDVSRDQPDAIDTLDARERVSQALLALDELPPASREVVILRYLNGESYDEIATQLGKTTHQVRSLCNKGIQLLRRKLSSTAALIVEKDR